MLPPAVALEIHQPAAAVACAELYSAPCHSKMEVDPAVDTEQQDPQSEQMVKEAHNVMHTLLLTRDVAAQIPYVVSALSAEWRPPGPCGDGVKESGEDAAQNAYNSSPPIVRVFLPPGCTSPSVNAIATRLSMKSCDNSAHVHLCATWGVPDMMAALHLLQVASMLQIDELVPELIETVCKTVATEADQVALETACQQLQLPSELKDAATRLQLPPEPEGLPNEKQVQGMIASALLTADGKVWRVVQKVIDRRESWPHLAKENASILLQFVTGAHGSIRAVPHTGFFWGSRDFLYLVCRYIRSRPQHFEPIVSAMFDSVYNMDPELPAEIIDSVFKELLVHDGLSVNQCEHLVSKLMQRETQLEYLFHEWSGVFPSLPPNARRALAKGLLPTIGRCPHTALDFMLKELDTAASSAGSGRWGSSLAPLSWIWSKLTAPRLLHQ